MPSLALRWLCEPTGDPSRRVVATGVFDLLHIGHARFLEQARATGTSLVVGVESDARVAARKGARPVVPARERGELLAGLRAVDGVFLVDGSPELCTASAYAELMRPVEPWALALTAGDPAEKGKREAAWLLGAGVVVVPLIEGWSTTALLLRSGSARRRRAPGAHARPAAGAAGGTARG